MCLVHKISRDFHSIKTSQHTRLAHFCCVRFAYFSNPKVHNGFYLTPNQMLMTVPVVVKSARVLLENTTSVTMSRESCFVKVLELSITPCKSGEYTRVEVVQEIVYWQMAMFQISLMNLKQSWLTVSDSHNERHWSKTSFVSLDILEMAPTYNLRKRKQRRLPEALDESETICGKGEKGEIGPCNHLFCFTCLMEWARVNNSCPQCKQRFKAVSRVSVTIRYCCMLT